MRTFYFYLFIIFTLFSFSQTIFAVSTDCSITLKLRVGSKGTEVECLQRKIGIVADGSFGSLTKVAILTFQSNNGLVTDGIVGPLTRATLNAVKVGNIYPEGCISNAGFSPKTGIKCDNIVKSVVNKGLNPTSAPISNSTPTPTPKVASNSINMDQFIKTVVEVSRKSGSSEEDIKIIADTLRETIINSDVDYNKKFEELLTNESKLSANLKTKPLSSLFDKVLTKTFSFLGIKPPIAHAAVGIPFGGALLFPFFCAYNASWMITISPLPPTFVSLLTYYPGTQGFASYNIPFTSWLLGDYVTPGVCIIPAHHPIVIPTTGTITPMVGSSPL
ncbi:MAG: peptidoglycan-binding domain-containing protein [Candidatus Paceibacterota bacterium]